MGSRMKGVVALVKGREREKGPAGAAEVLWGAVCQPPIATTTCCPHTPPSPLRAPSSGPWDRIFAPSFIH